MEAEVSTVLAAPMEAALIANVTASTPTVSELPPLKTVEFSGETISVIGHRQFLVASHSHPGDWYVVEEEGCGCRGFECVGSCRHFTAISRLLRASKENSPNISMEKSA